MKEWKIYWDDNALIWKMKADTGLLTMWIGTDEDLLDLQKAINKTIEQGLQWPQRGLDV